LSPSAAYLIHVVQSRRVIMADTGPSPAHGTK
jgi:hypothetical protein